MIITMVSIYIVYLLYTKILNIHKYTSFQPSVCVQERKKKKTLLPVGDWCKNVLFSSLSVLSHMTWGKVTWLFWCTFSSVVYLSSYWMKKVIHLFTFTCWYPSSFFFYVRFHLFSLFIIYLFVFWTFVLKLNNRASINFY